MRKAGAYDPPRYDDPNDRRLVQIIHPASRAREAAVNIIGIPFDGAVLGRRGAAGGPDAIRKAMSAFSNYNIELGLSLEDARIFDLGDLVVGGEDVEGAHAAIYGEVRRDLRKESLLVMLGGDNSVSLPGIRATAGKFGKVGVVVVDSHLDLRGRIRGRPSSGSSYGLAIETVEGVDAEKVVELGVHGFLNSRPYAEKAERLGVGVVSAEQIARLGAKAVAKEAFGIAGRKTDAVYFSVDLDAVDSSEVSGVSAPSAGGLSARELCDFAFYFGGRPKVKCADLAELAPSLDPSGRSQGVAAAVLVHLIAGFHARGRA